MQQFGVQFWTNIAGSFLQLFLGHYLVRISYQREHNCIETVSKHVFLNRNFTFCAILNVACRKEKSCNLKFLEPA